MFYIAAELSLPLEPFNSQADPEAKKEDEITKMAEAIMDKVVTQLLNEAAGFLKYMKFIIIFCIPAFF